MQLMHEVPCEGACLPVPAGASLSLFVFAALMIPPCPFVQLPHLPGSEWDSNRRPLHFHTVGRCPVSAFRELMAVAGRQEGGGGGGSQGARSL